MSWVLMWQLMALIGLTAVCVWVAISIWGSCRVDIEHMKFHGRTIDERKKVQVANPIVTRYDKMSMPDKAEEK